jgi:prepilin-type N-terminal cleavage/methylation domain-containing protein
VSQRFLSVKLNSYVCGFTLLELLIVVAIVAILGGIGVTGYQTSVDAANRSTATMSVEMIIGAFKSEERIDPGIRGVSMPNKSSIERELFDNQITLQPPSGVNFRIVLLNGVVQVRAESQSNAWITVCRTENLAPC